jgi:hypothetical protein
MTVNQLVDYKHSLFTVDPVDASGVLIVKSKCYKGYEYAVRGGQLLAVLSGFSLADDSRNLWHALKGERSPSQNDLDMFDDDKQV